MIQSNMTFSAPPSKIGKVKIHIDTFPKDKTCSIQIKGELADLAVVIAAMMRQEPQFAKIIKLANTIRGIP